MEQNNTIFDDVIDMLIADYQSIYNKLYEKLSDEEIEIRGRILAMINSITDYVLIKSNREDVRERVKETMGGKVLEFEIDRVLAKGRAESDLKAAINM